ncbi:DUF2828 family protein [Mycobacteroides abscessus]|uniref:DUF2828 family protein n=1 Tax=Mycobacteroides abscessus TaxID=36809 RepID=UPI0009A79EBE|nr:DUF2828 family protein [Mycobacteroides abscessus]SKT46478.1 Domain of uncharacterised function (DUF2828) [Mycobacteroides abscessus subsp. bolletii]
MTTFLDELLREDNLTLTENGAATNKSSLNAVVDYFAAAGAMRDTPAKAAELFEKAFLEDPQTAVRTMFYLRDVRGGQGERAVFRECYRSLAAMAPATAEALLVHIPEYGRWDDVFYDGSNVTPGISALIGDQLVKDAKDFSEGKSVSLLAKWLPSDKSKARKDLAINLRKAIGLDQRKYRKVLSRLRSRISLLEHDMSAKRWKEIDWGKLPSRAHKTHVKAFYRNTPAEYQAYLDSVVKGEAKVNAGTLYPYELYDMVHAGQAKAADALWANLHDYTRGNDGIVLADVSGSMWGRPMSVSVSLALYFADRNQGAYKDHFMTFSSTPKLEKVTGRTLSERMNAIQHSTTWCGSTDLFAAFRAILEAGKRSGEVPKTLYVVSDMEFDAAFGLGRWGRQPSASATIFEAAKREFADAGLELPHVVFWNVNARNSNYPALAHDGHVTLVSGLSPTVFGMAVEGKSPAELVQDVVNGPRYQQIVV